MRKDQRNCLREFPIPTRFPTERLAGPSASDVKRFVLPNRGKGSELMTSGEQMVSPRRGSVQGEKGGPEGKHYGVTRRFVLDCRHEARFLPPWPNIDDEILCIRCQAPARVDKVQVYWTCTDCRHSEFNGLAKVTNEVQATRHHFKYPDHTIQLYDTFGNHYQTIRPRLEVLA